jgi:hypothetical protein
MTVRPGYDEAEQAKRADIQRIWEHAERFGFSWGDIGRRRRFLQRAVRLRRDDPLLPDFDLVPDGPEGAGLLVSSDHLLVRSADLEGRDEIIGRRRMRAVPVEWASRRLARLVPIDETCPDPGIIGRAEQLRHDDVPAAYSYVTAMAVVIKSQGGAEPAERRWPPLQPQVTTEPGSVRVAVVDTGVTRQTRSDGWLAGVAQDPGNIDELDVSPSNGLLDAAAGHGTAVAGLVQSEAPAAQLAVYSTVPSDGAATETAVGEAMVRAVQDGFDAGQSVVLNLSLGTTTADDLPPLCLQAAVDEIAERAASSGHDALVVAAAGNYGDYRPVWPAACDGVVAVGALTQDLQPALWSSRGDWVTCSVIGDGVLSVYVEGVEDPEYDTAWDTFGPDSFALQFGTSFAAPQVAGRVAQVALEQGIGLRDALGVVLAGAPDVPDFGKVLAIQPSITV